MQHSDQRYVNASRQFTPSSRNNNDDPDYEKDNPRCHSSDKPESDHCEKACRGSRESEKPVELSGPATHRNQLLLPVGLGEESSGGIFDFANRRARSLASALSPPRRHARANSPVRRVSSSAEKNASTTVTITAMTMPTRPKTKSIAKTASTASSRFTAHPTRIVQVIANVITIKPAVRL
jgi:hypothetical protein